MALVMSGSFKDAIKPVLHCTFQHCTIPTKSLTGIAFCEFVFFQSLKVHFILSTNSTICSMFLAPSQFLPTVDVFVKGQVIF